MGKVIFEGLKGVKGSSASFVLLGGPSKKPLPKVQLQPETTKGEPNP